MIKPSTSLEMDLAILRNMARAPARLDAARRGMRPDLISVL